MNEPISSETHNMSENVLSLWQLVYFG